MWRHKVAYKVDIPMEFVCGGRLSYMSINMSTQRLEVIEYRVERSTRPYVY